MSNRVPESYRIADGCHNCKRRLTVYHYAHDLYYCMLGAPAPPKDDGVGVWGDSTHIHDEGMEKAREAWDTWQEGRSIRREGICDEHEKGE